MRNQISRLVGIGSYCWAIALVFVGWHLYVQLMGFNRIVLPGPVSVFYSIFAQFDLYLEKTVATLRVSILGLMLGALVGLIFGVVGWLSAIASGLVSISSIVVRSVPIVIFVPILATTMGYTSTMVIVMVALMSFFPSFVMVSSGLYSLPAAANDLSAVYGATALRKLRYVALPAAMPNFFASIRLSASRAILAAMVAEFLTGIDGLGHLFLRARADLHSEIAIGAAMVASIAAVVIYYVADALEKAVNRRIA